MELPYKVETGFNTRTLSCVSRKVSSNTGIILRRKIKTTTDVAICWD